MENLDFIFWDEQWQENTEQTSQQGGGTYVPTNKAKNDSKRSWG